MPDSTDHTPQVQKNLRNLLRQWGESAIPPTALASLTLAQALRPVNYTQLIFPPVLLFSAYLNQADYPEEAAAITGSWSALYYVLSRRRKQTISRTFSSRGIIRGVTQATCLSNVLGCGYVYISKYGLSIFSRAKSEDE